MFYFYVKISLYSTQMTQHREVGLSGLFELSSVLTVHDTKGSVFWNITHGKVSKQTRQEFISIISFLKQSEVEEGGGWNV